MRWWWGKNVNYQFGRVLATERCRPEIVFWDHSSPKSVSVNLFELTVVDALQLYIVMSIIGTSGAACLSMVTLLDHQCLQTPLIHPDPPQHDTQCCERRIAFNKLHRKDSLWCNPNVCTRQAKIYDRLDDMINRIIGWLPESTMTFERDQTQTLTSRPHQLHLLSGTGIDSMGNWGPATGPYAIQTRTQNDKWSFRNRRPHERTLDWWWPSLSIELMVSVPLGWCFA